MPFFFRKQLFSTNWKWALLSQPFIGVSIVRVDLWFAINYGLRILIQGGTRVDSTGQWGMGVWGRGQHFIKKK